jgi:hypothetical protein
LLAGDGWRVPLAIDLSGLSLGSRERLSAKWARDARYEHASVASFARFTLELMSVGAPADLVRGSVQAMQDEIRHAELCFGVAAALSGSPMKPGALPIDGALSGRTDLVSMVDAVIREACVGETISALVALEARDGALDPAARAALDLIAEDEARHAALAWRFVAWACDIGGAPVREAAHVAFADAMERALASSFEGDADARRLNESERALNHAYGVLDVSERGAVARRALRDVIAPAAEAFLDKADGFSRARSTFDVLRAEMARVASSSAASLPATPLWPGTYSIVTSPRAAISLRRLRISSVFALAFQPFVSTPIEYWLSV